MWQDVYIEGELYYKYDDNADKVVDGFPRRISADFGAKPGGSDVIPDNLDAAVFDNRDSRIYFFKADWVSQSTAVQYPQLLGRSSPNLYRT